MDSYADWQRRTGGLACQDSHLCWIGCIVLVVSNSTPRFVFSLKRKFCCDCTNVCVLREEIFADYDKVPKSLTGIFFAV